MSILIKGMDMPTARDTLVLVKTDGTAIVYEDEAYVTTAVPVPKHGRLIDADALLEWANADLRFGDPDFHAGLWHTISAIEDAPTIILAEPPKEET